MILGPDRLTPLIKQAVARIELLDADGGDAALFSSQLRRSRPDLFEGADDDETAVRAAELLARCMIGLIKEIPQIVDAMLNAIDRRTTEPAVRCALAGALSYLVRPRDLLPDDLPGGFGFVDDCMILRATVTEFLGYLPRGFTTAERERRLLELLAICIPPDRLPEFQAEVEGIWLTFHALLWEGDEEVDDVTERILRDPLGTPLPDPSRDTIPLPPGPRLSMAPGEERLSFEEGGVTVAFSSGHVVSIDRAGCFGSWE